MTSFETEFAEADSTANARKRRSQVAGVWAVVAVLVSLVGTACEPLWHEASGNWPKVIAGTLAAIGIGGAAVAWWGLLYGKHKHEWLRLRLKTERYRQFHFQTFLFHLPEMLDSLESKAGVEEYVRKRAAWFRTFKDHLSKETLGLVRSVTEQPLAPCHLGAWRYKNESGMAREGRRVPPAFFNAYATFRFQEQIAYADHVLRHNNELPAGAEATLRIRTKGKIRPWYPGVDQPMEVKRTFLRYAFGWRSSCRWAFTPWSWSDRSLAFRPCLLRGRVQ